MGRIRTIKPEFFKHSALFDAEQETGLPLRLAYAGLWTCCDRAGRFKWRPRELKLDVLPYDNCEFSRVLDALHTRGFLVKYAMGTESFGAVVSWKDHQFINNKEPESNIPEPPQNEHIDASVTREAPVEHASVTRGVKEGKGMEGKGMEGEVNFPSSKSPSPLPRSAGANGEFALALALMQELRLASTTKDIAIVAQVITLETPEHGGEIEAAEFIKQRALAAQKRGEPVTVFWLKDRKFAQENTNGTNQPSPTHQRVNANRAALAKAAERFGWANPDGADLANGRALPEPGSDGLTGGVLVGFPAVNPQILAPESHGGTRRTQDTAGSELLPAS